VQVTLCFEGLVVVKTQIGELDGPGNVLLLKQQVGILEVYSHYCGQKGVKHFHGTPTSVGCWRHGSHAGPSLGLDKIAKESKDVRRHTETSKRRTTYKTPEYTRKCQT
jgi:hypothetical protein